MPFARCKRKRRGPRWLGVLLVLGANSPCFADDAPEAAASPPAAAPASPERISLDAPPPETAPVSPDAPQLSAASEPESVDAASSQGNSPDSRFAAQQAPDGEAPALAGPSGFESAPSPAAPSTGGGPSRLSPDVEAPALAGPSGGEQRPPEEGGRYAPWWTRVPNVQPFPPLGLTIGPPRGPGYYTLLELLRGDRRESPPKYPYARFGIQAFPFFNADWRSLDNPESREADPFNFLKRIRLGDDFMFTTGGEWRWRYNNEVNSRLSGKDNTYYLTRTRVYGDFWYRDLFRIYGEFINAQSFDQDLPPLVTDQYNPNFLNLFADAKLGTIRDQPLWLRGGRQELLYGSERLISPLAWVNTQRTFQGGKLFWQNDKLSLDAFCVQPVVPSANSFASVNWQQVFSGVWGTYRPIKGEIVDLYYLDLQDSTLIYSGENGVKGALNVSTVGSRWYGNKNDWLWDAEGMLQFGRYSNQGILANAYTMGGGYNFSKAPMSPTLWLYYDYASGDPAPGAGGVHRTFNQLFPFGHFYFGMMDIVGRQNINDVNGKLLLYPVKWMTTWVEYHVLRLDSPKDALYNSAGVVERIDPTGKAGINVGEILTIVNNFTIDLHQNVFVQYSHLYAGDFLYRTGNGRPQTQDELYLMYAFRW
jgi:hypothetical protein